MSSTSAKLLFVVALGLNVVLWSRSRFADVAPARTSTLGLVKRFVELADDETSGECRPLSFPTAEQCAHIVNSCPGSRAFLSINYLKHYFCTAEPLRPAAFAALVLWLVFLFSTLGISASDFFTPNLATIAQILGLDENVAGVTFLAFGNGSPDVFSTFSAMRANSGSLAIGELLGAATFIVSCVVGSMCIIKPFRVDRGPFLRDVCFFTTAVTLTFCILWDGWIRPWEAGALIVLYLVYVAVVVVGTWWRQRRKRLLETEALIRAEYQDDEMPPPPSWTEPYRDDPTVPSLRVTAPSTPTRPRAKSTPGPPRLQIDLPPRPSSQVRSSTPSSPQFSQMPSFSLIGALEFRSVVSSLQNQASGSSLSVFDTPVTPYAGGHYHSPVHHHPPRSRSHTPQPSDENPWDATLGLPLDDRPPRSPSPTDQHEHYSEDTTIHSAMPLDYQSDNEAQIVKTSRIHALRGVAHVLFPSLHGFREKSVLGQVASLFAAPALLMLTLTLPVVVTPYNGSLDGHEKGFDTGTRNLVDFEEEGIERTLVAEEEREEELHGVGFNKWLMAAQCVCGPLFCIGVLFAGHSHRGWLLLASAIAGLTVGIMVTVFGDKGDNPTFRMARCSMGFLVAVVWIMAIADEVVDVLQTFGFIFGLSDAIIGLTIFAVGNSLADLVANMSVAVFAPIMGFSACFGGPMLNILLGVGISGSYVTSQTGTPYKLDYSRTLVVSTIGLLFVLASTLLFIPFNGYYLTRRWGIFLIASYVVIMVLNIAVELHE
ncbi:Sodium/calcium exchanger protein-domain-containing protein [Schizophyllum fasciatum]